MLKLTKISKSYHNKSGALQVLNDVSFELQESSFLSIFGPNGSGKTTLLNIIAGLIKQDNGQITFLNKDIRYAKVSYVFQNYRETLFPWLKIVDNITLPLKLRGIEKQERDKSAKELIEKFNIQIDLYDYPYNLSGGQQQLVALLRGLIVKPDLFLLDEPFSALDYQTTLFLYQKLIEIWRDTKITFILVSHDIDEAIYLSNRFVMFSNKPTKVIIDTEIDLPYPRNLSLLTTDKFIQLKRDLLKNFSEEIINKLK